MTDSTFNELAGNLPARKHAKAWHAFLALVSLASLLPFLAFPFARYVIAGTDAALNIVVVMTFIGANFHVAATAWFYSDRSMYTHFRAHPLRYLILPCLLIAGGAATFQFAPAGTRGYLLVAFFCWQLWHYQKQNLGLLSFIAAGTDGVPVSAWERRTLGLSALAGIAGFFSLYYIGLPEHSAEFHAFHRFGAVLYALVPFVFCVAVSTSRALRQNGLRLTCFAFGTLFFLPTFLFSDWISATLSYAIAHGLQYLVFMGFVSIGRPKPVASLTILLGLGVLGGLALNAAIQAPSWSNFAYGYALYGAFLGAVMTHFVLDAGLWRLREPFQRQYMRKKFYFVFDR
jgi:hypothetical protein